MQAPMKCSSWFDYDSVMALAPDDSRPPYRQIADELRRMVLSGEVAPGGKLPSNRQLMDRYGVAPQTVQSAFRLLKEEGLTYSVHGRGTFVRTELPDAPDSAERSNEALAAEVDVLRGEVAQVNERLDALLDRFSELTSG